MWQINCKGLLMSGTGECVVGSRLGAKNGPSGPDPFRAIVVPPPVPYVVHVMSSRSKGSNVRHYLLASVARQRWRSLRQTFAKRVKRSLASGIDLLTHAHDKMAFILPYLKHSAHEDGYVLST